MRDDLVAQDRLHKLRQIFGFDLQPGDFIVVADSNLARESKLSEEFFTGIDLLELCDRYRAVIGNAGRQTGI